MIFKRPKDSVPELFVKWSRLKTESVEECIGATALDRIGLGTLHQFLAKATPPHRRGHRKAAQISPSNPPSTSPFSSLRKKATGYHSARPVHWWSIVERAISKPHQTEYRIWRTLLAHCQRHVDAGGRTLRSSGAKVGNGLNDQYDYHCNNLHRSAVSLSGPGK